MQTFNISYLFVQKDMVVPEFGEIQQPICEAFGGPTATNMSVSDQEDLRLLLQVQSWNNNNDSTFRAAAYITRSCLYCLTFPCLHRLLQSCRDDTLNVAVPLRMLEIYSSEKTYLSVIPDANHIASLLEQILHYMVQKGKFNTILSCLVLNPNCLIWRVGTIAISKGLT